MTDSQPTDRRRSCRFGNTPDCRHHAHMLSILFRRSDQRFERQLSESCRPGR